MLARRRPLPVTSNRDLIVIGGSAGALTSIARLLAALPRDFPAAVVIVLHSPPSSGPWLASRLGQSTPLPVSAPMDAVLEQSHVYVASPDHHLTIREDRVVATRGPRENQWRPSIDVLFRTAAVSRTNRVVGVVLSGELDDGVAGLLAIKECGGVTVVEDPAQSTNPALPQFALTNVNIDHIVSLDALASLLQRLVQEALAPGAPAPARLRREAEMSADVLAHEGDATDGELTVLTCPDCGGPLRHTIDDTYRCLVGHAFAPASLEAGMNRALERTLWAAIRQFEQRMHISRSMAEQAHAQGREPREKHYRARADEAWQHAARLRELLRQSSLGD